MTGPDSARTALKRSPFRAWLVTGPIGRLIGFLLEFAAALWVLARGRLRR